jgi:hypothetical protein
VLFVGYYRDGLECKACPSKAQTAGQIAVFVTVIISAFSFLVVQHKRFLRLDDAMKSFLFYTQTIVLVFNNMGFAWPNSILTLGSIYSYANIGMSSMSCLNTSSAMSDMTSFVLSILPGVWALGLAIVAFAIGAIYYTALRCPFNQFKLHLLRCIHAFLFALNVVYLPVTVSIFQVFLCEHDDGDGKVYFFLLSLDLYCFLYLFLYICLYRATCSSTRGSSAI